MYTAIMDVHIQDTSGGICTTTVSGVCCDASHVGSLDTLHATDGAGTISCISTGCGRYCMSTDVSGVGSLDTLHATDGLVHTIPASYSTRVHYALDGYIYDTS